MDKEILWSGKYIRIARRGTWEYVERVNANEAAIIIPVLIKDSVRYMVLIEEWRIPLQGYNVGLPAGLLGDHGEEEAVAGARRELVEETGYEPGRMRYVCSGPPSSGLSNEILHFFVADKLTKVSDEVGVDGEDITVHVVPLSEVEAWLNEKSKQGRFIDPKVYMGLWFTTKLDVE